MKTLWPSSLLGRNIALLIATVMVSQMVAVLVFMFFVQQPRLEDAAGVFGQEIVLVQRLLAELPDAQRAPYVERLNRQSSLPGRSIDSPIDTGRPFGSYELKVFLRALAAHLPEGTQLRWEPGPPAARLWVQMNTDGDSYWIALPAKRGERYPRAWIAISLSFFQSLLAVLAAFAIHRRINRPLQQLVRASDRVGRDVWPDPIPTTGPVEIATVASAFNGMTARLAEMEATRAAMLAGISHDIRTPLTKLRLAIALRHDASQAAVAERSIEDIDAILQQFIDLARGAQGESPQEGDLNALVTQIAADFSGLGHFFDLSLGALPLVRFRPVSMLRVLMNVMQNAAHYGQRGLHVKTWTEKDFVYVAVQDRGPGVPEALLPVIQQPFRRGNAVDQGRGGTGLGLAIATRIIREHGGDLTLRRRERGGLDVTLSIRIAPEA